jgi:uncharacterized membrane protein YqaE (UPF0057 family)
MKKIISSLLIAALMISMSPFQSSASLTPGASEPDSITIKAAMADFKKLSKQEKKERIKEVKKQWKLYKKDKKTGKSSKVEQIVLIILAILLPPLAVYLHQGEVNGKFWISLLLWFIFILPGVIYALLVVTDTI